MVLPNIPFGILSFFILVSIAIFFRNSLFYILNFIMVFFILLLISSFVQPSFDHTGYIIHSAKIADIPEAFADNRPATSAASSLFFVVDYFVKNERYSSIITNSLIITSLFSLLFNNKFFIKNKIYLKQLPYLYLLFLCPITLFVSVGLNKDLMIAFLVSLSLLIFYNIYNNLLVFRNKIYNKKYLSFLIVKIILLLLIILNSLYFLFLTRPPMAQFLICSVTITCFVYAIRNFLNFKKGNIISLTLTIIFVLSNILFFKWNEVIITRFENLSNALILDIHLLNKPLLIESYYYVLKGLFLTFFGTFYSQFTWIGIGLVDSIILFFANIVFLILLILFYINRNKNEFLFSLIFSFILLHLGIQIWGTSNYINLYRQMISDIFLILLYLASSKSEKYRINNNSLR